MLHDLGEAEVCQHNITIIIQQNVLWFQIAVYDVTLMKVTECKSNLRGIKLRLGLRKALLLRQVLEELSALNKLHDEVNTVGLLEDIVHAYDERVVHLVKDELLDLK